MPLFNVTSMPDEEAAASSEENAAEPPPPKAPDVATATRIEPPNPSARQRRLSDLAVVQRMSHGDATAAPETTLGSAANVSDSAGTVDASNSPNGGTPPGSAGVVSLRSRSPTSTSGSSRLRLRHAKLRSFTEPRAVRPAASVSAVRTPAAGRTATSPAGGGVGMQKYAQTPNPTGFSNGVNACSGPPLLSAFPSRIRLLFPPRVPGADSSSSHSTPKMDKDGVTGARLSQARLRWSTDTALTEKSAFHATRSLTDNAVGTAADPDSLVQHASVKEKNALGNECDTMPVLEEYLVVAVAPPDVSTESSALPPRPLRTFDASVTSEADLNDDVSRQTDTRYSPPLAPVTVGMPSSLSVAYTVAPIGAGSDDGCFTALATPEPSLASAPTSFAQVAPQTSSATLAPAMSTSMEKSAAAAPRTPERHCGANSNCRTPSPRRTALTHTNLAPAHSHSSPLMPLPAPMSPSRLRPQSPLYASGSRQSLELPGPLSVAALFADPNRPLPAAAVAAGDTSVRTDPTNPTNGAWQSQRTVLADAQAGVDSEDDGDHGLLQYTQWKPAASPNHARSSQREPVMKLTLAVTCVPFALIMLLLGLLYWATEIQETDARSHAGRASLTYVSPRIGSMSRHGFALLLGALLAFLVVLVLNGLLGFFALMSTRSRVSSFLRCVDLAKAVSVGFQSVRAVPETRIEEVRAECVVSEPPGVIRFLLSQKADRHAERRFFSAVSFGNEKIAEMSRHLPSNVEYVMSSRLAAMRARNTTGSQNRQQQFGAVVPTMHSFGPLLRSGTPSSIARSPSRETVLRMSGSGGPAALVASSDDPQPLYSSTHRHQQQPNLHPQRSTSPDPLSADLAQSRSNSLSLSRPLAWMSAPVASPSTALSPSVSASHGFSPGMSFSCSRGGDFLENTIRTEVSLRSATWGRSGRGGGGGGGGAAPWSNSMSSMAAQFLDGTIRMPSGSFARDPTLATGMTDDPYENATAFVVCKIFFPESVRPQHVNNSTGSDSSNDTRAKGGRRGAERVYSRSAPAILQQITSTFIGCVLRAARHHTGEVGYIRGDSAVIAFNAFRSMQRDVMVSATVETALDLHDMLCAKEREYRTAGNDADERAVGVEGNDAATTAGDTAASKTERAFSWGIVIQFSKATVGTIPVSGGRRRMQYTCAPGLEAARQVSELCRTLRVPVLSLAKSLYGCRWTAIDSVVFVDAEGMTPPVFVFAIEDLEPGAREESEKTAREAIFDGLNAMIRGDFAEAVTILEPYTRPEQYFVAAARLLARAHALSLISEGRRAHPCAVPPGPQYYRLGPYWANWQECCSGNSGSNARAAIMAVGAATATSTTPGASRCDDDDIVQDSLPTGAVPPAQTVFEAGGSASPLPPSAQPSASVAGVAANLQLRVSEELLSVESSRTRASTVFFGGDTQPAPRVPSGSEAKASAPHVTCQVTDAVVASAPHSLPRGASCTASLHSLSPDVRTHTEMGTECLAVALPLALDMDSHTDEPSRDHSPMPAQRNAGGRVPMRGLGFTPAYVSTTLAGALSSSTNAGSQRDGTRSLYSPSDSLNVSRVRSVPMRDISLVSNASDPAQNSLNVVSSGGGGVTRGSGSGNTGIAASGSAVAHRRDVSFDSDAIMGDDYSPAGQQSGQLESSFSHLVPVGLRKLSRSSRRASIIDPHQQWLPTLGSTSAVAGAKGSINVSSPYGATLPGPLGNSVTDGPWDQPFAPFHYRSHTLDTMLSGGGSTLLCSRASVVWREVTVVLKTSPDSAFKTSCGCAVDGGVGGTMPAGIPRSDLSSGDVATCCFDERGERPVYEASPLRTRHSDSGANPEAGKLYLGVNRKNGDTGAIKRVPNDEKHRLQIDILSTLSHANIVRFHGVDFSHTEGIFLLMELVTSGTLADVLAFFPPKRPPGVWGRARFTPLPLKVTKQYMTHVLNALSYIHERGIIHRDISINNIMVTCDGECKLVDFGESVYVNEACMRQSRRDLSSALHQRQSTLVADALNASGIGDVGGPAGEATDLEGTVRFHATSPMPRRKESDLLSDDHFTAPTASCSPSAATLDSPSFAHASGDPGQQSRAPTTRTANTTPGLEEHSVKADRGGMSPTPSVADDDDAEGAENPEDMAMVNPIVGTPVFMSPQACRGVMNRKNDIWAVGIITFYCLTGFYPYPDEVFAKWSTASGIVDAVGKGGVRPVLPSSLKLSEMTEDERADYAASELSDDSLSFIRACLTERLSDRSTAKELLRHRFINT